MLTSSIITKTTTEARIVRMVISDDSHTRFPKMGKRVEKKSKFAHNVV